MISSDPGLLIGPWNSIPQFAPGNERNISPGGVCRRNETWMGAWGLGMPLCLGDPRSPAARDPWRMRSRANRPGTTSRSQRGSGSTPMFRTIQFPWCSEKVHVTASLLVAMFTTYKTLSPARLPPAPSPSLSPSHVRRERPVQDR